MTGNGYIKLHRKLLNWGWYKDQNTKAVFLHLLLTANYAESEYMGVKIHPGQTVIGRKSLAKTLGMSEKNIRTALNHLKSTNEVAIQTTNRFSIVTIVNWEFYQVGDEQVATKTATKTANKGPASGHTIRNKESKNKRKGVNPPSLSEVSEYVKEMGYKMDPSMFYDYYESVGWTKKNGQAISNWKAAARTWEHREQKYGGENKHTIEPPKYKVFEPEPEIDAVEMPDEIRKAVDKFLK